MPQRTPEAIAEYREAHRPRDEQCRAALALANARRAERRKTIQALKGGILTFDTLMHDPPDCLDKQLAVALIMLVPGVGKDRRNRIAIQAFNRGVLITKDLGDLTHRQRTILAAIVRSA